MGKVLSTLLLTLCLVVFILVIALLFFQVRPMIVYSDSMKPTFAAGDILFVHSLKAEQVQVGDMVTFQDPERQETVTHRLISKEWNEQSEKYEMITQGDANTGVEKWAIYSDGNVGRTEFIIPYVGYPLHYLQSAKVGFALLILCVALFGGSMLWKLWRPSKDQLPTTPPQPDQRIA